MAKFYEQIQAAHKDFISKQKMYFVGTAPLSEDGRINLSPKGLDSFKVLGDNKVAYMDLTGSGNETSAHTRENGRITFMFCAYDGPPNILRLYGKGRAVLPDSEEWDELSSHFTIHKGTRQIIVGDIDLVQTSCGFVVPLYEYKGMRDHYPKWADNKGEQGLVEYRKEKNTKSLDGMTTDVGARE